MSIYDPTCGSAGMLLEAVQHLKDRGEDPRSLSLYGQEKNLGTWAIAEINLFLHDIDDAFIAKGDTILSPKRYDPKATGVRGGRRRLRPGDGQSAVLGKGLGLRGLGRTAIRSAATSMAARPRATATSPSFST